MPILNLDIFADLKVALGNYANTVVDQAVLNKAFKIAESKINELITSSNSAVLSSVINEVPSGAINGSNLVYILVA